METSGWHIVAHEDLPDTTRIVWIRTMYIRPGEGYFPYDYLAYRNANGWFFLNASRKLREPPILWHELAIPKISLEFLKQVCDEQENINASGDSMAV